MDIKLLTEKKKPIMLTKAKQTMVRICSPGRKMYQFSLVLTFQAYRTNRQNRADALYITNDPTVMVRNCGVIHMAGVEGFEKSVQILAKAVE